MFILLYLIQAYQTASMLAQHDAECLAGRSATRERLDSSARSLECEEAPWRMVLAGLTSCCSMRRTVCGSGAVFELIRAN